MVGRPACLLLALAVVGALAAACSGAAVGGRPVSSPSTSVATGLAAATPTPTPEQTPTTRPTPTPEPTPLPTPTVNEDHATVYWVFAHPDDETISSAGAMYESQEAGNRNVLITLTDGETTRVGSQLGLSLKQVAAAREKEATAALAVVGIVPVFLHEPETGGGVQVEFVEREIAKLASETKGTVIFEGLGPDDAYLGLPHGDPDHYTVARALLAEFNRGVIKNLVFRHLANFSNGRRYGTCEFLSSAAMKAKQEMRAAYAYVNPSIGRYGIAGRSVRSMWLKTTAEPECYENAAQDAGVDPRGEGPGQGTGAA